MEDKKIVETEKTSLICHVINSLLFLVIVIVAMVPLIYHIGSHDPHQDIPHSLS